MMVPLAARSSTPNRSWLVLAVGLANVLMGVATIPSTRGAAPPDNFETLVLRGRVVWLSDALLRQHGVQQVPEAAERVLVLETVEGKLHPLVEDTRGRSFRRDERLRKTEVELTVRRHCGSPFIQVIRVCAVAPDGLYQLDYWCEICSIAMYELKDCDCCQGPIELRRRKLDQRP